MFEVKFVRGGRKPCVVLLISDNAEASTDILPEVPPTKNLFPSLTTVVPPTNIADTPVAPVTVNEPLFVKFPSFLIVPEEYIDPFIRLLYPDCAPPPILMSPVTLAVPFTSRLY